MLYAIKVVITAVLVVVIAEVSKRNSIMAGIYASIPLTSLLAMIWLYLDTQEAQKVASLSWSVLVAVVPSHIFLIAFPLLIKLELNFWLAMSIAIGLTVAGYYLYAIILRHFDVSF